MRELKPLHLPILVAARYSSDKQALQDVTMPSIQSHNDAVGQTSLTSTLSSTPPTPTSLVFSHSRHPSTQSAYSSTTSPGLDQSEPTASASKLPLPQLTEEPFEAEEAELTLTGNQQSTMSAPYKFPSLSANDTPHSTVPRHLESAFSDYRTTTVRHDAFNDWVVGNECFFKSPAHQRQNSSEPAPPNAAHRLPRKMASFSSSLRHRKQDSKMSNSGLYIHTASTQTSSTRTSSMTSSVFDNADFADRMRSRKSSDVSASCPTSPIDSAIRLPQEFVDREKQLPPTPLLPPFTPESHGGGPRYASPLQSPLLPATPAVLSMRNTPNITPQIGGVSPKLLSSKTSFASLRNPRFASVNGQSPQALPFFIADPNDKWAAQLGHANFNMEPAPYFPSESTSSALSQLNMDYEEAKLNYFRHNMRTIEHYGQNSRTFKLTEQKWAEVDAEWRSNIDMVTKQVAARGPTGELFPAYRPVLPLSIITKLPDMKTQNKFPELGDVDIVGPMTQVAARNVAMIPSPTSPRGRSFFRLFSGRSRSRKV